MAATAEERTRARAEVDSFFRLLLLRAPDAGGLDHWTNSFINLMDARGFTFEQAKAEIHNAFVNSDEYRVKHAGGGNVPTQTTNPTLDQFDADHYLANNPGVANAPANWFPNSNSNIGGAVKDHPDKAAIAYFHFISAGGAASVLTWRLKPVATTPPGATTPPAAGGGILGTLLAPGPLGIPWIGYGLGVYLIFGKN